MVDQNKKDLIDTYVKVLKEYNEHTNVYSKNAYDHLEFHIQDSINMAEIIGDDEQTVLDMGSGSGLPSVILAIQNPNNHVIAVDSKHKKITFLRTVKEQLNLTNYEPIQANIVEFFHSDKRQIDVVTAKAFKSFQDVANIANKGGVKHKKMLMPISQKQYDEVYQGELPESYFLKKYLPKYLYILN